MSQNVAVIIDGHASLQEILRFRRVQHIGVKFCFKRSVSFIYVTLCKFVLSAVI